MNRNNALTVKYNDSWKQEDWQSTITKYGIEYTAPFECKELEEKVLWLSFYDKEVINTMLSLSPPAVIMYNLNMYFDDGKAEIRITAFNYTQYDYTKFYMTRTGKYDPIEEELTL